MPTREWVKIKDAEVYKVSKLLHRRQSSLTRQAKLNARKKDRATEGHRII